MDGNIEIRAASVGVWDVEAAGAEKADSHGDAGAGEGREGLAIGLDCMAAKTLSDGLKVLFEGG